MIPTRRIVAFIAELRHSYWFVPAVMTLSAFAVSFGLSEIELAFPIIYEALPTPAITSVEGARTMLSTIAGSMITVAGVTFSITIAAIAYTAGQFGPRILNTFLGDRGNQLTLGIFIATFVYCLVVLGRLDEGKVVPQISMAVVGVLTFLCTGFLVYFLHHVPRSIHISNIVSKLGSKLVQRVEERRAKGVREDVEIPNGFFEDARIVRSSEPGYVQVLSPESIIKAIAKRGGIYVSYVREGDFVIQGSVLGLYRLKSGDRDQDLEHDVRSAIQIGSEESSVRDIRLLGGELIEVAARALSPGVNDPFTAIRCLNWLNASLFLLDPGVARSIRAIHKDGDATVLIFEENIRTMIDTIFGQLRPYFQTDLNASLGMIDALAQLRMRHSDSMDEVLEYHARVLVEGARESLSAYNASAVEARYKAFSDLAVQETSPELFFNEFVVRSGHEPRRQ